VATTLCSSSLPIHSHVTVVPGAILIAGGENDFEFDMLRYTVGGSSNRKSRIWGVRGSFAVASQLSNESLPFLLVVVSVSAFAVCRFLKLAREPRPTTVLAPRNARRLVEGMSIPKFAGKHTKVRTCSKIFRIVGETDVNRLTRTEFGVFGLASWLIVETWDRLRRYPHFSLFTIVNIMNIGFVEILRS